MMRPGTSEKPESTARRGAVRGKRRRWVPYLGGLFLAALIVLGLWPKPVPVETAVVTRGLLQASVNEEGKTRIRQRYVVAAPVAGQLRRISFKAGADVIADQTVVAVIDPISPTLLDARSHAAALARRDSALASLEKARVEHAFSTSELRRSEKLFAENTISIRELETARTREAASATEQANAQGALRLAQAELDEFFANGSGEEGACPASQIKAPASGKVLRVLEENTRVVAAGTPLLEIGDPANLEAVIEVLSRDGARIVPGDKIEFAQWGGAAPLRGKVRLVEPAAFTKISALGVEEQRVNVIADLLTPPEERRNVGDNFRLEARIIVWEAPDALKVPAGALFRQGDQWATFALIDGRARLKQVKVGPSSGTETQILEGLDAGTPVILYPSSRVHDGQKVSRIVISAR